MARLIVATALLLAGSRATTTYADEAITDDVASLALEADLEPMLLQGAVNAQHLDTEHQIREYLYFTGDLQRPYQPPPSARPTGAIPPSTATRIFCIEGIESHHGAAMYNPIPVGREHAQGWLGYLPSTARSVGVTIGNRDSEWAGAVRMLATGRGNEFFGIRAGLC